MTDDGDRGSSGSRQSGDSQQSGGEEGSSRVEKAVMVVSAVLTVAIFAYAGWQAAVTPSATAPEVQVIGTETMSDGSVVVITEVTNPQDVGLRSVTVEANCTSPPPQLQYQHVPADGRRVGRIVCPAGTTSPEVSVSTWVEA